MIRLWLFRFNRSSYIIVIVLLVVHQIFLEIKTLWLKICLLYGVLTQRPSTLKICYVNISGVYNKQLNMAKVVYLHDVLSFISKRNCFMKLWWHALLLMWYLNLSRMVWYMRVLSREEVWERNISSARITLLIIANKNLDLIFHIQSISRMLCFQLFRSFINIIENVLYYQFFYFFLLDLIVLYDDKLYFFLV